jgi:hypothetical protein
MGKEWQAQPDVPPVENQLGELRRRIEKLEAQVAELLERAESGDSR